MTIRNRRRISLICGIGLAIVASGAGLGAASARDAQGEAANARFHDAALSANARVADLLSRMTLDEKIAAFGAYGAEGSVPRLGVGNIGILEGINGLVAGRLDLTNTGKPGRGITTTQFPMASAMGQSWNRDLLRKVGDLEAKEARYIAEHGEALGGAARPGIVMAPVADLVRDPRWGRASEAYSEDPVLAGELSAAMVRGLQGEDPDHPQVGALLKHFLANSHENGRYVTSANFDERLWHEYYALPFQKAFAAGARSFMASYNAWNSVPTSVDPKIRNMLRAKWKVDGLITTDAGAFPFLVDGHSIFDTEAQAAAALIRNGVSGGVPQEAVRAAINEKLVTEADLDYALAGRFRMMARLGLLDKAAPAAGKSASPIDQSVLAAGPWNSAEHKSLARQVAQESIVLLKNMDDLLPLDRSGVRSIAVYGSHADRIYTGVYSGLHPYGVTPLEALKQRLGDGVKINADIRPARPSGRSMDAARNSDVAIVFVGNDPNCNRLNIAARIDRDGDVCADPADGMENADRRSLTLQDEDLIRQVQAANPKTIVVLLADFPYAMEWTAEHVPAILTTGNNGQEEGNAIVDVLFGDYNPAGRTAVTWPRSLDQLPPMLDYDIRHGRTYMYAKHSPLFAFGHGLSYSRFRYDNIRLDRSTLGKTGVLTIRADVTNTSDRDGDEVVQLYASHHKSAVKRPLQELKDFRRLHIAAGQVSTVTFQLPARSLAYWDPVRQDWVVEADEVALAIGPSSAVLPLTANIVVK